MAIPPFDAVGNLPIGDLFKFGAHTSLVHATLAEIHHHFVESFPDSPTRQEIWDGWMRHRLDLERIGVPYATIVDGSFVTSKPDPEDVDICLLIEASALDHLGAEERDRLGRLLLGPGCKEEYRCDAYPLFVYPFNSPRFYLSTVYYMSYWTRVFGIDRKGNQKSFLLVTEEGTV